MHSQYGEDEYVLRKYFKKRSKGVYLELGAMDGITFSNTLLLEKMGWKGVLIEANPFMAQKLCQNRPRDRCYNYAVAEYSGTILFSAANHEACGAVDAVISEDMRKKRHLECNKFDVPCAPLSKIVDQRSFPRIDFWSLDVEGSELECLRTFDWNIEVSLIMIEMLDAYREKNDRCREFLGSMGYIQEEASIYLSEFWIKSGN